MLFSVLAPNLSSAHEGQSDQDGTSAAAAGAARAAAAVPVGAGLPFACFSIIIRVTSSLSRSISAPDFCSTQRQ